MNSSGSEISQNILLKCLNLSKSYEEIESGSDVGPKPLQVLDHLNFELYTGQQIAIIGKSGSGKSTFLNLLGGLDTPTSGNILFQNQDWQHLLESERARLRNQKIGFIYQFHHLLPEFTALENIAMPLLISKQHVLSIEDIRARARDWLDKIGLSARETHKPGQLSGGERQRIAIARAMITEPDLILADEPTGNLDAETADRVFKLMHELNQKLKTTFVIVTHDDDLAARLDHQHLLSQGGLTRVSA